jgi:GTP-binding protein YchF
MHVGLAGMPGSGKSTVFRAVTGLQAAAESGPKGKPFPGVIDLPDPRLEKLRAAYKPRKVTPLKIHVLDIPGPGPAPGDEARKSLPPRFVADMRTMDVLCAVTNGFDEGAASAGGLAGQIRAFRQELILQDLDVVEKKHQRLAKGEKEGFHGEKELFVKIRDALEAEEELRALHFPDDTLRLLGSYAFLTLKPVVYVLNLSESRPLSPEEDRGAREEAARQGAAVAPLFGRLELDLLELPEADRKDFLRDAGLEESGVGALIRTIYGALGLIVFYTAVGEELRAWGIPGGLPVVRAAGKIHTDMEKGFIKADVIGFEDFETLGSEAACRRENRQRQEGKGYIVQDGDILSIKFNV